VRFSSDRLLQVPTTIPSDNTHAGSLFTPRRMWRTVARHFGAQLGSLAKKRPKFGQPGETYERVCVGAGAGELDSRRVLVLSARIKTTSARSSAAEALRIPL
jgi:hypothetical protein